MKIKFRLILSLLLIFAVSFYVLSDFILHDIRPRYLESAEESMNDMAVICASYLETELQNNRINVEPIKKVIEKIHNRKISAMIYQMTKTNVNINVYVVDKNGIVLYDSFNNQNTGKDFSEWNDVLLTLKGKYGARATRIVPKDPNTSILYVAAPIRQNNKIIGAVTVAKPQKSIQVFMTVARQKILYTIGIILLFLVIVSIIVSSWITKPITKLFNYVKMIKKDKKTKLPKLGSTEIHDLGLAFEDLVDKLEGKKYIEEYIHTLTHEIKSPLSSITGAAELLQEELPQEQKIKYYKNIQTEAKRIKDITDKLLNLADIENRKELTETITINIRKLLEDIQKGLTSQLKLKEIEINLNIKKDDKITGDPFLIKQALINLIQNAINYSPNNTTITIETKQETKDENNFLRIDIIDQGAGIPEYALNKIFNRFYSVPIDDRKIKNTGLGLSFVKEVAKLHHGKITVDNNKMKGVIASLYLPH